MNVVLRASIIFLAVSGVVILIGLLVGQALETEVILAFYTFDNRIYDLQVRQPQRTFYLDLAGTRCFEPLPQWAINDLHSWVQAAESRRIYYEQAAETVTDVRCR